MFKTQAEIDKIMTERALMSQFEGLPKLPTTEADFPSGLIKFIWEENEEFEKLLDECDRELVEDEKRLKSKRKSSLENGKKQIKKKLKYRTENNIRRPRTFPEPMQMTFPEPLQMTMTMPSLRVEKVEHLTPEKARRNTSDFSIFIKEQNWNKIGPNKLKLVRRQLNFEDIKRGFKSKVDKDEDEFMDTWSSAATTITGTSSPSRFDFTTLSKEFSELSSDADDMITNEKEAAKKDQTCNFSLETIEQLNKGDWVKLYLNKIH